MSGIRVWLALIAVSVSLCACRSSSQVALVNATDEVVSSAVVAVPGSRLEVRDLAAGGTHTWRYRSERDACFEVSARLASGSTIEARCVGYTTPNEGISHRLTLNRDRTVEYQVLR